MNKNKCVCLKWKPHVTITYYVVMSQINKMETNLSYSMVAPNNTKLRLTTISLQKQGAFACFSHNMKENQGHSLNHSQNCVRMDVHVRYRVCLQIVNKYATFHRFRMKMLNWLLHSNNHYWRCTPGFSIWPTNMHHFHQFTWVQMFQIFNSAYMRMTLLFNIVSTEFSQALIS